MPPDAHPHRPQAATVLGPAIGYAACGWLGARCMRSPNQEVPNAGGADYDCSKGVVGNLTHVLALELAPLRINVNNLGPGMVLTPINQPAIDDPEPLDEQVQSIPLKRRPNRQRSPAWPCFSRRRTATT